MRQVALDLAADLLGSTVLAIGVYCFVEQADIAPGGISGIAILFKYLFNLPIGMMTFLLNVPILYLGFRYLGRRFTLRSMITLAISSVILDFVITPLLPQYTGDRMIASIFGGVCMGAGLGLIFLRGSTTAGTDIISCLLERRFPHIQIGTALMLVDCAILATSVLFFQNLESGLFGLVALFCQTKVIDGIVYGLDRGREILIISLKNEEIAARIISEMERSATFLEARGAYRGQEGPVLLCVLRLQEYHQLKTIVHEVDPSAFPTVNKTIQILG